MQSRHSARFKRNISSSGLSIYDRIAVGDPELWIPTPSLEKMIDRALRGLSVAEFAGRARSKFVVQRICAALGYPVPVTFEKTRPRFVGQLFNVHTLETNNLQLYDNDISPDWRYVLIRIRGHIVQDVRVISGEYLVNIAINKHSSNKCRAAKGFTQDKLQLSIPPNFFEERFPVCT